jgi:hypothetical protein
MKKKETQKKHMGKKKPSREKRKSNKIKKEKDFMSNLKLI